MRLAFSFISSRLARDPDVYAIRRLCPLNFSRTKDAVVTLVLYNLTHLLVQS
jgi:hypothetical protein